VGKQTTSAGDLVSKLVTGSFTGTGVSGDAVGGLVTTAGQQPCPAVFKDLFNIALWGTFVATLVLEKSFDGGANWIGVAKDSSGNINSYTAPFAAAVYEPEHTVIYRWRCTSYTSGTIFYRISQ